VTDPIPLRVLTLWQPWAFAVAHWGKDVENRPYKIRWPHLIGIHSGRTIDDTAYQFPPIQRAIAAWTAEHGPPAGGTAPWEQSGQILAIVRIARDVHRPHGPDECDGRCSEWAAAGCCHNPLTDVVPITPIGGVRGRQSLWEPPADLAAEIHTRHAVALARRRLTPLEEPPCATRVPG
jgi:hypothetical protein